MKKTIIGIFNKIEIEFNSLPEPIHMVLFSYVPTILIKFLVPEYSWWVMALPILIAITFYGLLYVVCKVTDYIENNRRNKL